MGKDFKSIEHDVVSNLGALRKGAPNSMQAFASLANFATATDALDTKTKELMALAIGIAVHCDGCVAYPPKRPTATGRRVRKS